MRGSTGSAEVEERLTEEEERGIEERVKRLYAGMVRGLKRVLLEEVAKRATEEYYGAQGRAQENEGRAGEPRNSPETVLRKHEECDKESARRQVQGALEQAGRRGALVSECAGAGELTGRTC